nr:hypothetical protein [Salipiger mangrovisoli]
MITYASAAEDKQARREAILEAALALFLEDTRRLPTVASVATRSKLAKGTIYICAPMTPKPAKCSGRADCRRARCPRR